MSLITDLRAISGNAVEQVAARFSELPRPLLVAIGAGDMAVERLADLREALTESVAQRVSATSAAPADVRPAVSDLPAMAQKVAADVAAGLEQFASEAPVKAQELIAQLPAALAEFTAVAQSLSPEAFRGTVEAYTQLVGMIYGSLAERGDRTWFKVRTAGLRPGAVIDADLPTARPVPSPTVVVEVVDVPEPSPVVGGEAVEPSPIVVEVVEVVEPSPVVVVEVAEPAVAPPAPPRRKPTTATAKPPVKRPAGTVAATGKSSGKPVEKAPVVAPGVIES